VSRAALVPLRQWICDGCQELIPSPEAGMLEWRAGARNTRSGFRIVHQPRTAAGRPEGCGSAPAGGLVQLPLTVLAGEAGMALLLSLPDVPAPEGSGGPWVEDAQEFLELARRLTVPHYEEARGFWRQARADGFFAEMEESERYHPRTLGALLERYRDPR
jgi:hypothetical protein